MVWNAILNWQAILSAKPAERVESSESE
jgi:hypothetical protein